MSISPVSSTAVISYQFQNQCEFDEKVSEPAKKALAIYGITKIGDMFVTTVDFVQLADGTLKVKKIERELSPVFLDESNSKYKLPEKVENIYKEAIEKALYPGNAIS